jgi:hypothetical protein
MFLRLQETTTTTTATTEKPFTTWFRHGCVVEGVVAVVVRCGQWPLNDAKKLEISDPILFDDHFLLNDYFEELLWKNYSTIVE